MTYRKDCFSKTQSISPNKSYYGQLKLKGTAFASTIRNVFFQWLNITSDILIFPKYII